ncbi:uncharacterized protein LOC133365522 isoform X3 [Rhineura floridana]|uniref:uncharacterized protein LOC133365522 isoform X3 n=1 Tax=Rhineura floridana TaxID=261503 RepID=UPI002AC882DB|nr:uncharacterized protein LOC133365522 isoform X3 [Rhineura floridana]
MERGDDAGRSGSPRDSGGERASAPEAARQAERRICVPVDVPWQQVTFKDVAVSFSTEEWSMLEGWQRELHKEVMLENYTWLLSLGHSIPLVELSSLICQPEGTTEGRSLDGAGGEDSPSEDAAEIEGPWDLEEMNEEVERCLTPASNGDGECPSSLHLCALMKLVKDIPEFLCGHAKANGGPATAAGSGNEAEVPNGNVKTEARLESPQGDLPDVSLHLPGHPGTPARTTEGEGGESHIRDVATNTEVAIEETRAGRLLKCKMEALLHRPCQSREQNGSPQADREAEPCATRAADTTLERSVVHDDCSKDGGQKDGAVSRSGTPQATASGSLAGHAAGGMEMCRAEPVAREDLPEAEATADSGHQPLLNSWKERGADSPDLLSTSDSTSLSSYSTVGERPLNMRVCQEGVSKNSPPTLAQGAAAEGKPLQGLLKCLKELIVHQPQKASHKRSTGSWQPIPGRKRREVGSGHPLIQVKIEAPEEEPPAHSPGSPGRRGSSCPLTPPGSISTFQTKGGRRTNPPEATDNNLFAAVKVELMAASPPLHYLDRCHHSLSTHGATGEDRAADETGVLHVEIKMEEPAEEGVPLRGPTEAPEEERGLQPNCSGSHSSPEAGMVPGLWTPHPEAWSPVTNPLHGLLNCLKDIPGPRPVASGAPAGKRGGGERRKAGWRGRLEVRSEQAATEKICQVSSQCCTPPSLAVCNSLPENFLLRGPEGFLPHLPTALPSGYANSNHRPDVEAGMTQEGFGAPLQGLERCSKELPHSQPCSPAISSSVGSSPDRPSRWNPGIGKRARKEEGLGRNSTPLQGLERCLKDLPFSSHSQPSSPAVSSSFSSSPDRLHMRTPEAGKWRRKEEGLSRNSTSLQGLERCLKELPRNTLSRPASPAVSSSISSSPDGLHRWTPEPARWTRKEEGLSRNSTPLQGLESRLKDLPGITTSPVFWPAFRSPAGSSSDGHCKPERGERSGKEEAEKHLFRTGASPLEIPPLQGLQKCLEEIPVSGDSCPDSAAAASHFSIPALRRTETSPQRLWAGGGPTSNVPPCPVSTSGSVAPQAGMEMSPLHRLMNCLKEIPMQRPSYLQTPNVSSSSSSSSSCSETERDRQSPSSDCGQDTVPGSEVDEARGPKGMDSRRRKDLLICRPSEEVRRLPSTQQPELIDRGDQTPLASPLHGLESCLKDIATSQQLRANIPPAGTESPGGVIPVGSKAGIAGSCSTALADDFSIRDPPSCPKDAAATARMSERSEERGHLEAWVQRPQDEAKKKGASSHSCLQGLANFLAEIPAKPPHRSKALPRDVPGNSEQRGWDVQASFPSVEEERATESTPLQGLLRCLKDITARGPSPSSPSSSNSPGRSLQGESRNKRTEEAAEARRASWEGLGSRLHDRPTSTGSAATTPLSSPRREAVKRSPPPEVGGRLRGAMLRSTPTQGNCPKQNGYFCLLSGRSAALKFSAQRQTDSSSPKSGVKRSLTAARDNESQTAGGTSYGFRSQGEVESGYPCKKSCTSLDPSSPLCNWGNGKPQECRAEVGGVGPDLSKKLDRLSADMSAVCRDVSRLQSHVDRLEQNAQGWVLELATLRMENRSLSEYVRRMEGRCRSLENRSRRNNLRVVGLPEGAEGSDAVSFLQKTLPALLGLPSDTPPLEIESARRVQGGVSWDPSGRPRPLLFQLLRSADKVAILQAARTRTLSYASTQITILPDFCSSLSQRRRVPFGTFRRTRWAADLCFGSPHPSCYYAWAPGRREPLASSGPLASEREGRVSKGPGVSTWGTDPLADPVHHGGCHSAGSCEQHNDP